jgi:hypothetical protein
MPDPVSPIHLGVPVIFPIRNDRPLNPFGFRLMSTISDVARNARSAGNVSNSSGTAILENTHCHDENKIPVHQNRKFLRGERGDE